MDRPLAFGVFVSSMLTPFAFILAAIGLLGICFFHADPVSFYFGYQRKSIEILDQSFHCLQVLPLLRLRVGVGDHFFLSEAPTWTIQFGYLVRTVVENV